MSKKSAKKMGQGKNSAGMRVVRRVTAQGVWGSQLSGVGKFPGLDLLDFDRVAVQNLMHGGSLVLCAHESDGVLSFDFARLGDVRLIASFRWLFNWAYSGGHSMDSMMTGGSLEFLEREVSCMYVGMGLPASADGWGLEHLVASFGFLYGMRDEFRARFAV